VAPLIRSEKRGTRTFAEIRQVGKEVKSGDKVLFRGRVDSVRGAGNLCFLVLRQRVFTLQCVVCKSATVSKDMVKFVQDLRVESIVDIEGELVKSEKAVDSCTVHDVELQVSRIFIVSQAAVLKVQVSDCAVPPAVFAEQKAAQKKIQAQIDELLKKQEAGEDVAAELAKLKEEKAAVSTRVKVGRSTRLDNRIIDLRTRANNGIFRIQSGIAMLFREFLLQQEFVEIHSPKLLGAASEGGASVFKLPYFDKTACLAQSPQLYKQMAIASDFGRVFEVGPVFRAEDSFTRRHLCEFMGLDMEMAFNEHYHEATDTIGQMFCYIFDNLPKRFADELAAINDQYPFKPLRYQNPPMRFTWPEIVKILRENGEEELGDFEDIGTEQETKLGQIIADKFETDFYWVDKFPATVRPFYTMTDPADERYTNSYDFFLRGWEITSGAQRIHDPEMLTERAQAKGVTPDSIKDYIDAFRYGCPPHAGCGIGLERIVMLYLGLKNIRQSSLFPRDPKRLTP
jgi:aspartyl-tRNA synthetase